MLVGALIPLLIKMAIAFHRAAQEITEIGAQLRRTLDRIELIADRVELMSRGLERNMKIVDVISTVLASAGAAVAAFVKTRVTGGGDDGRQGP